MVSVSSGSPSTKVSSSPQIIQSKSGMTYVLHIHVWKEITNDKNLLMCQICGTIIEKET